MSARSFTLDKKKQGNVLVEIKGNVIDIRLYGSLVAYKAANGDLILSSCGYKTNTTKTAINRFLELIGRNERVVQIKGNWFLALGNGTSKGLDFVDGMKVPVSRLEKALA